MMKVKLSRDGRYGKKGAVVEVTVREGEQMIADGVATAVRKKVSNKAMSAKG